MAIIGIIILFVVLAVIIRLLAGSLDTGRVEQYIRNNGWKLIDKSWDPFGPGWFGDKSDRIYEVIYEDQQGNTHRAHAKTSMFSGVYLTNDTIVQPSTQQADLEKENEQLKRRIAELENTEKGTTN
jgi:hypothetical protein